MVNEQFVGNFSCEWEDVHSTPDFDQVVAFPFPYLHPFVPLNDIVSDIFDLFLGVRVLILHQWGFKEKLIMSKQAYFSPAVEIVLLTWSLEVVRSAVGLLRLPSVSTLLPPTVIRIQCFLPLEGRYCRRTEGIPG